MLYITIEIYQTHSGIKDTSKSKYNLNKNNTMTNQLQKNILL